MRNLLLIWTFFLLLGQVALGQTYSSTVSDKEIYDFLNWMTKYDKKYSGEPWFKGKQICQKIRTWDKSNFNKEQSSMNDSFGGNYLFKKRAGTDTIFNKADREYILRQYSSIKDSIWRNSFASGNFINCLNQKRPNRYYYSIPLFSIDKSFVIVSRTYVCGNECAHGGYYIYRKRQSGKWEYVTTVNGWMS